MDQPITAESTLDTPPFPLIDLPLDILLRVVKSVDERNTSPTFPRGPSDDLLNLSCTNKWFARICRPLIWRSIHYQPLIPGGPHPTAYRQARSLKALREIIQGGSIQVQELSVDMTAGFLLMRSVDDDEEGDETLALVNLIETLSQSGLQVLFMKEVTFSRQEAIRFFNIIASAPRLSAIRFNQVDMFTLPSSFFADSLPPLQHIRTLQIMHGSSQLLNFISKCPNLDSLLLWPSSRRLGVFTDTIKALLPRLRLLSMDSVRDPSAFRELSETITRLASQRYAEPLPLEELFLEGPMNEIDRSALIASLVNLPSLRRLALYQARRPTPTLYNEIYRVRPDLKSLTIVGGDCDGSILFPTPLEDYLLSLSQFKQLEFYASDRRTPPSPNQLMNVSRSNPGGVSQAALEFESFAKLVKAVPSLKEAVAIDQDVSEGTTGYFASFAKEKGKIRISQKMRTANDFLVSYDRWVRVEED
ncbi:hypothetical protein JCM5353_001409 [Sporobolomyces roseus]